ncbi:proline racemase family protein [Mesorhizobium sp. AR10]|uniref:proline racemase family protein n=1 Tax=Mesorhizobium sp. AR10 TaxID=2865839 RepID=UPI00215F95E1|nr:proline racemase family protein [Mesorhizobium sp. AR10]UVK38426.1 proline racemase family protein [Mesorhizobium sp. AR10]
MDLTRPFDLPSLSRMTSRMLEVVDSHTCGQPTRVVIAGADLAPGLDPNEARELLRAKRDWVRRVSVFEPRGHRSMFSVALIAPASPGDDYGVVYMDAATYPDMCGHATIGAATTLIELGLVGPIMPGYDGAFEFGLRTPAGRVELRATLKNGRCEAVAFRLGFAFYLCSLELRLGDDRTVPVHIAHGGQWYAFIDVAAAGLRVEANAIDALIVAAQDIRARIAAQLTSADPRNGKPPVVGNIVWTDTPRDPQATGFNVPVSAAGSFDRSPCGTATCARMAALVALGQLEIGQSFVNEGLMGTLYRGMPVSPGVQNGIGGIVAQVEGSAWITAHSRLLVDERDPLGNGYLVGGGAAVL